VIHLPEATALIAGLGGSGGNARLAAAFGMTVIGTMRAARPRRHMLRNAPSRGADDCCRAPTSLS